MYNRVKRIQQDSATRDELRQYFRDKIEVEIVKTVLARKDATHLADAKKFIDDIFYQMAVDFDPNPPKEKKSQNR